jgi:hypothetical protein
VTLLTSMTCVRVGRVRRREEVGEKGSGGGAAGGGYLWEAEGFAPA